MDSPVLLIIECGRHGEVAGGFAAGTFPFADQAEFPAQIENFSVGHAIEFAFGIFGTEEQDYIFQ